MLAATMIGGPNDGADLYPEDHGPCLTCGRIVGLDFDGRITWHVGQPSESELAAVWATLGPVGAAWCPGSRRAW